MLLLGLAAFALAASSRPAALEAPGGAGELAPGFRAALAALVAALAAAGIRVRVGSTLRSQAAQDVAYDAGRSSTRHSRHTRGLAVDLYPIDPVTGLPDMAGQDLELYRRMHAIAARLGWRGLAFGPDGERRYLTNAAGKRFWDGGHLEWTGGAS